MYLPCRTLAGEAELARVDDQRLLHSEQRLLELIDGRHTLDELLPLAAQAGLAVAVLDRLLDRLLDRGLVAMHYTTELDVTVPGDLDPQVGSTAWPPLDGPLQLSGWLQPGASSRAMPVPSGVDLALEEGAAPAPLIQVLEPTQPAPFDPQPLHKVLNDAAVVDAERQFLEARLLVDRVLERAAPWRGALTRWQARRAGDRQALRALMPEVQRRLQGPRRWPELWPMVRRAERLLAG
ncbi:MAG: hypothetical protein RLZZ584_3733 [Pseudomonadota bacterium]|jgi:hypothetical protein